MWITFGGKLNFTYNIRKKHLTKLWITFNINFVKNFLCKRAKKVLKKAD